MISNVLYFLGRAQLSVELISSDYFIKIHRDLSVPKISCSSVTSESLILLFYPFLRCKSSPVLLVFSYLYHFLMMPFYSLILYAYLVSYFIPTSHILVKIIIFIMWWNTIGFSVFIVGLSAFLRISHPHG